LNFRTELANILVTCNWIKLWRASLKTSDSGFASPYFLNIEYLNRDKYEDTNIQKGKKEYSVFLSPTSKWSEDPKCPLRRQCIVTPFVFFQ